MFTENYPWLKFVSSWQIIELSGANWSCACINSILFSTVHRQWIRKQLSTRKTMTIKTIIMTAWMCSMKFSRLLNCCDWSVNSSECCWELWAEMKRRGVNNKSKLISRDFLISSWSVCGSWMTISVGFVFVFFLVLHTKPKVNKTRLKDKRRSTSWMKYTWAERDWWS